MVEVTDVDHVAIRVTDIERSLSFYHDTLGMPVRDRDRFEAGEQSFVSVVAGGRHIHLFPTDEPFDVGREHICLLVRTRAVDTREAMDALLSELREQGVEVNAGEPHTRLGAYGRDWAAYVRDPDGRTVELKLH